MVSERVGEQSEEEVDEDYSPGDIYYPSVRLFSEYIDEFNQVTHGNNDTATYRVLCNSVNETFFPKNDFGNRCYKVAKYLDYIKLKKDEHNDNRCKCLNYLLNSNDDFNKFPGYDIFKIFKAYEKISSDLKICSVNIDCIRKEDLEKIKKLYILHDTYSKLQKSIEENDENIFTIAENFAQHYENSIDGCQTNDVDGYCGEINEIRELCYYHTKSKNCADIAKLMQYQKKLNKTLKIILPCITLLAIPFFLYIFYKFTTFGSWVNKKILKKERILDNLFDESQFQNSSEQLNLQDNRYNIKYHVV
ncbi:PIR protein [Plasmodium ovale]|uniref:PIR protein n=1 Tax=Plasmodium ovale TaxID=36330 RepID=A0A1C3KJ21_PLAOA|nr:PIR protein [Plasmodium ovale]